jgi:hypothetical protein
MWKKLSTLGIYYLSIGARSTQMVDYLKKTARLTAEGSQELLQSMAHPEPCKPEHQKIAEGVVEVAKMTNKTPKRQRAVRPVLMQA